MGRTCSAPIRRVQNLQNINTHTKIFTPKSFLRTDRTRTSMRKLRAVLQLPCTKLRDECAADRHTGADDTSNTTLNQRPRLGLRLRFVGLPEATLDVPSGGFL